MSSTNLDPVQIEQLIAERLEATVKAAGLVKFVYRTKAYKQLDEQSQIVPSLVVIYNGMRPVEQPTNSAVISVDFDYLVVIVVRSSKDALRATGAKADAGTIFIPTLQALVRWKPAPGLSRMTLAEGPPADYDDAGLVYLPSSFTTRLTITPTP